MIAATKAVFGQGSYVSTQRMVTKHLPVNFCSQAKVVP